jgi:hypothetical protein
MGESKVLDTYAYNFLTANDDFSRRQLDKAAPGQAPWELVRRDLPDITLAGYNAAEGEVCCSTTIWRSFCCSHVIVTHSTCCCSCTQMTVKCYDDGTSSIHIQYKNLPALYPFTVWK